MISVSRNIRSRFIRSVICVLLTSVPLFGQYWSPASGGIHYDGGNVGIGTTSPGAKLEIDGGSGTIPLTINNSADSSVSTPLLLLSQGQGNGAYSRQPAIAFLGPQSISNPSMYYATIRAVDDNGGPGYRSASLHFATAFGDPAALSDRMVIEGNGNVGIGTTNPQYRLAVNGNIGAQDIIVTNAGWSDYVCRPGYRLRPLSEVSQFIRKHHHLPDIPTEAEVKEKGVSLGDMQAKLLAKVEELTLHMIQQEKENRELRDEVNQQTKEIQELRHRLTRPEKGAAGGPKPAAAKGK